jgi:selenocysteine-specific elongation factor
LFVGASEVIGRLRLLGADVLKPGEEGWLQLELSAPVVVVRGDRYILRRPSPGETLGGGVILDPRPAGRHKRFDNQVLERLEALMGGTPEDIFLQAVMALGVASFKEVVTNSGLEADDARRAFDNLHRTNQILILEHAVENVLPESLITSRVYWEQLTRRAEKEFAAYRRAFPLRLGIPREELKSRLKVSPRIFSLAVERWLAEGIFAETAVRQNLPGVSPVPVIHSAGYQINLSATQQNQVDQLLDRFKSNPYAPPTIKEASAAVGEELYNAMIDLEYLIPLNGEVVFRREDYEKMVEQIRSLLAERGEIRVAEVRDAFQTSRRYVLAILEHLDRVGVTARVGDVRKLK